MKLIQNKSFYCKNKDNYPPFKSGYYLEEFFFHYLQNNETQTKRKYIPALWTNFQIEQTFKANKSQFQNDLDNWIKYNNSEYGYFTVVQYDDGPLLKLPENTIVYGACSGDVPIPLIYQDTNNTLQKLTKKTFTEKSILCSFVGNITSNGVNPDVRRIMFHYLENNIKFKMVNSGGWTPHVNQELQKSFLNTTIESKFALAPRGYGRSSFRFFECFLLGTIPIYVWNDIIWLPFQNIIDYDRLCIVIHISKINELENKLISISEIEYNSMWLYYHEIKHLFNLEGMTKQILIELMFDK